MGLDLLSKGLYFGWDRPGTDKTRVLPNTPRYLGPRDCVSCEHHTGRHTITGLGALACLTRL